MGGCGLVVLLLGLLCAVRIPGGEARGVIAVLQKASKLSQLQVRNHHLDDIFYKAGRENDFDVVIFCEKYVKTHHQQELQNASKLPLKFVFVDEQLRGSEHAYMKRNKHHNTKKIMERICPANPGSNYFPFGYKAMCQFWFTDFQQYVQEYDWLLRVDDDCHLLKLKRTLAKADMSSLFPLPDHVPFAPAMWTRAEYCSGRGTVTGLQNFTQEFATRNNISSSDGVSRNISTFAARGIVSKKSADFPNNPTCIILAPYTNVFYINLKWLRNDTVVQSYMQEVKATGCIFNNRWGDLELWGSVQLLLESPMYYYIPLPYIHGSHKCKCDPYFLAYNSMPNSGGFCDTYLSEIKRFYVSTSVNLSFPLLTQHLRYDD